MINEKHFLKELMPRLYDDIKKDFADWVHGEQLIEQLDELYVVGRCSCGADFCCNFWVESADPKYAPIGGRRPLYSDLESVTGASIMIGLSSIDEEEIFTGFEILSDYDDRYIDKQLESIGLLKDQEEDDS